MTSLCTCPAVLIQFTNCRILRDHSIIRDDLWIRDGKIQNPEKIFFDERALANVKIDCQDAIIAPGFIDAQINGAFGVDFSDPLDVAAGVDKVARGLLSQGVTAFCPTVVTSPPHIYKEILPNIKRSKGSKYSASVLGVHLEGPFISREKKGAHPEQCIKTFPNGLQDVLDTYGNIEDVAIVTLAPELPKSEEVIRDLTARGVVVSVGHSTANLVQGEEAVHHGATFITHLFNAMLPFHHRDPHLVGLLTSERIPPGRTVFYGLISDGIHTHDAALRIAHRVHPAGLVLVTDAIRPMGLPDGRYNFGQQPIEVCGKRAVVAGTETLCGSIANMDKCVQHFAKATGCGAVLALEAASLHAAQVLGLQDQKGTLDFGSDADLIWLNDALEVQATFVGGQLAWCSQTAGPLLASYPL